MTLIVRAVQIVGLSVVSVNILPKRPCLSWPLNNASAIVLKIIFRQQITQVEKSYAIALISYIVNVQSHRFHQVVCSRLAVTTLAIKGSV